MFIKNLWKTIVFSENLQKSHKTRKKGYFWATCIKQNNQTCLNCTSLVVNMPKWLNMLYPSKLNAVLFRRNKRIYLKFLPDLRAYNVSQRR